MSITEAITLLKAYNGPLGLMLHKGASEELIRKAESTYGITLPADFKTFYRFTDGFETVEYIFNMITLDEIIDSKNQYKYDTLYIAEYMIYCDMWQLEVKSKSPNEYSICYGELLLTHSLGEFISRFLKGGVFEIGGLYAWHDEIEAKLYGNTVPVKIKPLLWVYSECLKSGLMTMQEVVGKAEWIIATEEKPHHFFNEVLYSQSLNGLVAVLDSIHLNDEILQVRAFFSVINLKILIDRIETDHIISIIKSFSDDERFTAYEKNKMKDLIFDSDYLHKKIFRRKLRGQLRVNIKDFFNNYRFNLHHFNEWEKINTDLVAKFESMKN